MRDLNWKKDYPRCSFVLAKKKGLNHAQKEMILTHLEEELMGEAVLDSDSTQEEIDAVFAENRAFGEERVQSEVMDALKKGLTIYAGWISMDEELIRYGYLSLFRDVWEIAEKEGDGTFYEIDCAMHENES